MNLGRCFGVDLKNSFVCFKVYYCTDSVVPAINLHFYLYLDMSDTPVDKSDSPVDNYPALFNNYSIVELPEETDPIMDEEVQKILERPESFDDDQHHNHLLTQRGNLHDRFLHNLNVAVSAVKDRGFSFRSKLEELEISSILKNLKSDRVKTV